MPDWVIAVAVVFGTLLGVGIQEFRRWREMRERYQVMTFPKRLEAHQRAFSWCHELNVALNQRDPKEIHRVADEARAWWNANCFFLDSDSRRKMIPLFNAAHDYADGIGSKRPDNVQLRPSIWRYLSDALKAITEGIGDKYLPETSTAEAVKQEEKETGNYAQQNLLQRYIMSRVILFFSFGLLSIYAYYLSGTGANMSIWNWVQYIVSRLLIPIGIASIVWAFILSIVGLNCKIPEGVREKIKGFFMEGNIEPIIYSVTMAVFGVSFATTWANLLRTGIGVVPRGILFGTGLAIIIILVVANILNAMHWRASKAKTKNDSETQDHGA